MKVAFLHARQDATCARMMLASVRKHIDAEIVQLTDEDTEPLVDSVRRLPWNGRGACEFKLRHLAAFEQEEILVLDTDVIVQYDLSKVFAFPFAVALTKRDDAIKSSNAKDVTALMPFNGGVVWCRSKWFWTECHRWVSQQEQPIQDWYGDQYAYRYVSEHCPRLILACENWNYAPKTYDEDTSGRFAVHYKGERKAWLKEKARIAKLTA